MIYSIIAIFILGWLVTSMTASYATKTKNRKLTDMICQKCITFHLGWFYMLVEHLYHFGISIHLIEAIVPGIVISAIASFFGYVYSEIQERL